VGADRVDAVPDLVEDTGRTHTTVRFVVHDFDHHAEVVGGEVRGR
jgi:hypothetical protein